MAQSLLATDGYKFSMAEAGWPLRRETFYYSHRKGGPQVLPLDVPAFVRSLLPKPAERTTAFSPALLRDGPRLQGGHRQTDALVIRALPRARSSTPASRSSRSPVRPPSSPGWSRCCSAPLPDPGRLARRRGPRVTCERSARSPARRSTRWASRARMRGGFRRLLPPGPRRGEGLVEVVKDPARIFEVGLRAATCLEQHEIALRACREAGIRRTSNVVGARTLGMIPVGTMGHEHIQRYGSDEAAFRAMRERRPGRSSYLLDTYDTLRCGIPAAFQLIREEPGRGDSIRYDSGDKEMQYRYAVEPRRAGASAPSRSSRTAGTSGHARFEELRAEVGWKPEEQFYGYGGHLVARPRPGRLRGIASRPSTSCRSPATRRP